MKKMKIFSILICCIFMLVSCSSVEQKLNNAANEMENIVEDVSKEVKESKTETTSSSDYSKEELLALEYEGLPYVEINNGTPFFSESDKKRTDAFESYSDLDVLGRVGVAYANICIELMPTEERGEIGSVKPTGWHTVKYEGIDGNYLYNRCHLIGFQLAGENANEKNLATGTRYLNIEGNLPFENMVADYVKDTGNHVLYRITPIFDGENLLMNGELMEGYSVEDDGEGIMFCVYVFNVQPGIVIDYTNGESYADSAEVETSTANSGVEETYIVNTKTKKFHTEDCANGDKISEKNLLISSESRDELIAQGYEPAGCCNP